MSDRSDQKVYPGEEYTISKGNFIITEFDGVIIAVETSSGGNCGFIDKSPQWGATYKNWNQSGKEGTYYSTLGKLFKKYAEEFD